MSLANIPVENSEILSRFILYSKWIRSSDHTIKPEAFMPHPHIDMSVTRQMGLSETELWQLGRNVADTRCCTLYGSADIEAGAVKSKKLSVEPSEPPRNHANIKGYPEEKSAQKLIAMDMASKAVYIEKPVSI